MTEMPQMVALDNGMGGGAACAIAAIELFGNKTLGATQFAGDAAWSIDRRRVALGSLIAWAKLDGLLEKPWRIRGQQVLQRPGFTIAYSPRRCPRLRRAGRDDPAISTHGLIFLFFGFALIFGVLLTLPIGGADMPVVISIYNAFTGLAVGLEGFVLQNPALMIAGMVVGGAGTFSRC